MHATKTFHISRLILAIAFASIPALLAAQPAPSPGVPDFYMSWTMDVVGGGEWRLDEFNTFYDFLEVHQAGEAYVDMDSPDMGHADPFSIAGSWDSISNQTQINACDSIFYSQHWVWTISPSASQPKSQLYISVDTAPDGSFYVRDPWQWGGWQQFLSTAIYSFSASGADCNGPVSDSGTTTYPDVDFPVWVLPGNIPATNPQGTHFLKDLDIVVYRDPFNLHPVLVHWHVEIVDLDQCGPEICDELDNDCDGVVDDGVLNGYHFDEDADGYGHPSVIAYACTPPSGYVAGGDDCDDSSAAIYPGADEICNGADDDCDGFIDEGHPGGGAQCGDTDEGECSYGTIQCHEGSLQCVGAISPTAETCDGTDNDCDGSIDEGNPGGDVSCDTGQLGVCAAGTTLCSNGSISCTQNVQPSAEICDGLDNDCDGTVDEGNPGGGQACDTGLLGVCAAGTMVCSNGSVSCTQNVQPSTEICDGLDNDCDGAVDNGNPGGGLSCDTGLQGLCAAGTTICSNGSISCTQNVQPSAEICDGLDNDCDGSVDEGNPDGGIACGTLLPGVCATGTTVCSGGSLSCVPNVGPSAEVCDALDNDCDGSVDEGACASALLLASLSPARVWIGLQNDADAGIRFDLAAKIYLNDVEVGSGQLNSVAGGLSGFDNAKLDVMKLDLLAPVPVPPGSSFRIEVLVRNACRRSGKNSGRATLWYNGQAIDRGPRADAGSRFDASIGGAKQDYFLRDSAALSTTPGSSRISTNQDAGSPCSAFKSFGTWTMTLP